MCYCISYIYLYAIYTYILPIFQMCIQISLKKRHVSIMYIYIYYVIKIYTQIHMYVTQIPTSAHNLYKTLWI